jgi:hypothetical protein
MCGLSAGRRALRRAAGAASIGSATFGLPGNPRRQELILMSKQFSRRAFLSKSAVAAGAAGLVSAVAATAGSAVEPPRNEEPIKQPPQITERKHAPAAKGTSADDRIKKAGLALIGRIEPRHARQIVSNNWTIGCETLDRQFADYEQYKKYVGPLGAKTARIQGGWARTEQKKGAYDFAWIDRVVDDLLSQGVHSWCMLGYGNPLYKGGGAVKIGEELPNSPEGLSAWDRFVAAHVTHFKDRIAYWEIWNEPNHPSNPPAVYADFAIRTAETIRRIQPGSRITGMSPWTSSYGSHLRFVRGVLARLEAKNKLHLVDEIAFHDKPVIPETKYGLVEQLQMLVAQFSSRIIVKQGENGWPSDSTREQFSILRKYEWTERTQAKTLLRDMLGDYARNIPHCIFSISDIHYPLGYAGPKWGGALTVGLLKATAEKKVEYAKPSYFAAQNAIAIFDDTLQPIRDMPYSVETVKDETKVREAQDVMNLRGRKEPFVFHAFRKKNQRETLFMVWFGAEMAADEFPMIPVNVTYRGGCEIVDPVYVDLLSGNVYDIPKGRCKAAKGVSVFENIPVYDSPVLVAERAIVRPQMLSVRQRE